MAGDSLWPYVVLSMDFTGAHAAAGWGVDQRGNVFATQAGSPVISTSWAISGNSSLYLNGSSRIISSANIAGANFGSGDFEISLWFAQTSRSGSVPAALLNFSTDTPAVGWRLAIGTNGSVNFFIIGVLTISTGAGVVPLNSATHLSVARIGGTVYIRVNGVEHASSPVGAIPAFNGQLQISGALGANWVYTGYIDRMEILKGAARHAPGPFTPETGLMLNYASQVSGVVRDDEGAPCARIVRVYRRDTGALIGSTTSDGGTGIYTINCPDFDEVQRVVLDDASGALYNDLIDRIIPA